MPEIPAKLSLDLERDVGLMGGVLAWARDQPGYDIVRQKKARKLGLEIVEPAARPDLRQPAAHPNAELLARLGALTAAQQNLTEQLSKAQEERDRMVEDLPAAFPTKN